MKIYLASGNPHKLEEFTEMIDGAPAAVELRSADALGGMPPVDECGETLEANARLKAEALAQQAAEGDWILADDSGLLVDALDGRPGVYSARYAGPGANAVANNIKLLHEMHDVPFAQRTARFACVLCFKRAGGISHIFEGTCEGHILKAPSGDRGFGYDPLFQPLGYNRSFADLESAEKHRLSHRGKAVENWLFFVRGLLAG